jgi:hypothetical protein
VLLNERDALGIRLGTPLTDGEELDPHEEAPLTLGRDEGMSDGTLLNKGAHEGALFIEGDAFAATTILSRKT